MSTPAIDSRQFGSPRFPERQVLYWTAVLAAIAVAPFLIWPVLAGRILTSNFLPHFYCYLGKPGLVWTHVAADSVIGLSYVMISGTLVYLVHRGNRDIPFHWMFLAFGSFIVACGATHFMEVVTVWVPVYVLSAGVKVITALVSVATAALLPFTVPRVISLVQTAKASEAAEAKFHQVADNIQEVFWMVDAITKQVIYVNPAFEQITGRSRASLQAAPLFYREIIHRGDRARVLSRLDEATRSGKFDEEFRITRPDGAIRWVGTQGFPVRDARGSIYRLAGVAQDITERKRADDAQRRLAAIVESSDDGIISKDLNGVITSWNAAAERIFGYTEAEAVGQPITIIIPPALLNEEAEILRKLRASEHLQHYETTRVTKQGRIVDVSLTISPMKNSAGEVVGASKIARDITERKQAEDALRRNEAEAKARAEELAVILDAVPGMALIARDPTCRKITGSRAAYDMLRLPYGANISEIAPDGERPSNCRIFQDKQELPGSDLPLQKAAATGKEVRESEISLVFDDGSSREILGNAAPLLDDKGAVRGAVGVFVDITERKRVEDALRESEDRYRDLVEHSQDLLCTHDLQGKLLSSNPAPARILGYEVAELLKIPMRELIAPEYREEFDQYLARVRTAGVDKGLNGGSYANRRAQDLGIPQHTSHRRSAFADRARHGS